MRFKLLEAVDNTNNSNINENMNKGDTMRFNCRCGKPDCNESASTALRFRIFNEGIKNNRQKMMAKAKMKPKGSMTDIAKKLGIKIEEDFLTEDTLVESKADQQKFIDKFGKEFFDIFWNNKQRLKNKDINVDILWHVKHTSLSDMRKILDSISDEARAQEVDIEGTKLPEPTGNYDVVYESDEYIVYHPHDYVSSIYCAKGGRWCTAGGYSIPEGQVKVSQAKQYFNQYTGQGVELYYFIKSDGDRYALAVYPDGVNYEVFNKQDVQLDDVEDIPGIDDIEIEGLDLEDMKGNGSRYACENCGERLQEGDIYWGPESETYCESCFYDLCGFCGSGEGIFDIDDMHETPNGDLYCTSCFDERYVECDFCHEYASRDAVYSANYYEVICDDCMNSGDYVWCAECEEILASDDATSYNNEFYCDDCFDSLFQACDSCGAITPKDELTDQDGGSYCLDCADRGMDESYSVPMKFRLVEDIAAVKKNYPKISDEDFDRVIRLDPTFVEGKDSVGTYGKWLLNLFNKGKLDNEGHVKDVLTRFEGNKKYLKNKDIGQFKSLEDVDEYLNDNENYKDKSHRQEVRDRQKDRKNVDLEDEALVVYKDNLWTVWTPETYAASCKLGQGSSWCTASTESDYYYKHYRSQGPLYIIINNANEEEKYQFHFPSGQFMDIDDRSIELMQFLHNEEGLYEFFKPEIYDMLGLEEDDIQDGMITAYICDKEDYKDAFGDLWEVAYNLSSPEGEYYDTFDSSWGYDVSFDYLPVHSDLPESIKEELARLGIEDYTFEADEYPELKSAITLAVYRAEEDGALNEAYEDLERALSDADANMDRDNGIKVSVSVDEFESYLDDCYEAVSDYQDVIRYIFNDKIYFKEPYYGWQGFDDETFLEELLYRLQEIEELH